MSSTDTHADTRIRIQDLSPQYPTIYPADLSGHYVNIQIDIQEIVMIL